MQFYGSPYSPNTLERIPIKNSITTAVRIAPYPQPAETPCKYPAWDFVQDYTDAFHDRIMPLLPQLDRGLVEPHACNLCIQVTGEACDEFLVAAGVGDENVFGHGTFSFYMCWGGAESDNQQEIFGLCMDNHMLRCQLYEAIIGLIRD